MNKKHLATLSLLSGTVFLTSHLLASDLGEGLANESDALLLQNTDNNYRHWNGIGKIFWDDEPRCTASLLDTRDRDNNALGPAYILTAAHCTPGQSGPMPVEKFKETVKFNYFNNTLNTSRSYTIKQTLWKDYKNVDLAILELDVTLDTLLGDGITPLKLTSEWTEDTKDILIVGAPERLPEAGLRLAACTQEPTAADLVESSRTYFTTFKNNCNDIRPGSSGSPVLDRKSGRILSVVTTTTYGATIEEQCFQDAPCEVKDGQTKWSPDTHYSHPADYLSTCFSEGVFTDVANACTVDYVPFKVTDLKYWPTHYVAMPKNPTSPAPMMNAEFSLNSPYYRFKTERKAIDCRSPQNYSSIISAKDATIKAPLSRELGMHYLCVVGVESSAQRPGAQLMKNVWATPAQLVERTPVQMPEPTITLSSDWSYTVKWLYRLPTHVGTLYYASPDKDLDCSKVKLDDYIETYEDIAFKAEVLPLTLCGRNSDLGRRLSKARTDVLALP